MVEAFLFESGYSVSFQQKVAEIGEGKFDYLKKSNFAAENSGAHPSALKIEKHRIYRYPKNLPRQNESFVFFESINYKSCFPIFC
jgi:hypothetical protein